MMMMMIIIIRRRRISRVPVHCTRWEQRALYNNTHTPVSYTHLTLPTTRSV